MSVISSLSRLIRVVNKDGSLGNTPVPLPNHHSFYHLA
jgi:hypothetical protein